MQLTLYKFEQTKQKTFAFGLSVDFSDEVIEPIDELGDSPGRLDVEGTGRLSEFLEADCPKELSDFVLPET